MEPLNAIAEQFLYPIIFFAAVFCAGVVFFSIINNDTDHIIDIISYSIRWVYNTPAIALAGAFLFVASLKTPPSTATPASTAKTVAATPMMSALPNGGYIGPDEYSVRRDREDAYRQREHESIETIHSLERQIDQERGPWNRHEAASPMGQFLERQLYMENERLRNNRR